MTSGSRFAAIALPLVLCIGVLTVSADQRLPAPSHPSHPPRPYAVQPHVFIGGYFYDPMFGPYPWWPRATYPYWYEPVFDMRAEVRLRVEPTLAKRAAVYVDGFYAGIVDDDFNLLFQALPLTAGGHRVVLFLEGYRTVSQNVYLSPGSSMTVHETLVVLPPGVMSEPPELAPPLPEPPAGSYRRPITPQSPNAPGSTAPLAAAGFGSLQLVVQPPAKEIIVDGQRWATSEPGHFLVQVPAGMHRVQIDVRGYLPFATELEVGAGVTLPLNVSLMPVLR